MAQLTVYIDEATRRRIEVAARRAEVSVSQWVKQRLANALETEWPDGFFDLLGSLRDVKVERPDQPDLDDDVVAGLAHDATLEDRAGLEVLDVAAEDLVHVAGGDVGAVRAGDEGVDLGFVDADLLNEVVIDHVV